MKQKIDSREIVNNLRKLLEYDLMTKQATLFDVHIIMERLQEWYGGEVKSSRVGKAAVLQLVFKRTEINVFVGTFDDFTISTMFVTWSHNNTAKLKRHYDVKEDGSFDVFGTDPMIPLYNVPFSPELAA